MVENWGSFAYRFGLRDRPHSDQNNNCNAEKGKVATPRSRLAAETAQRPLEQEALAKLKQRSAKQREETPNKPRRIMPAQDLTGHRSGIARGVCSAAARKSQQDGEGPAGSQFREWENIWLFLERCSNLPVA